MFNMFAFIGGMGPLELGIILVIAVLVFGARRIPEIAKSLGKGIKEFKKAGKEVMGDVSGVAEQITQDTPKGDSGVAEEITQDTSKDGSKDSSA